MEPSKFALRWNEYLVRTNQELSKPLVTMASLHSKPLPQTARFLAEVGLPQTWSGPFSFDFKENLKPVSDVYGCYGQPGDWGPADYKRMNVYLYLGFDGGNNPVCLDTRNNDSVVFLIYARMFDRGEFINSSVAQLAECILIFEEMLSTYQQEHGEEADLYADSFPRSLAEQALSEIRRIDADAVGERSYWLPLLNEI